MLGIFLEDYKGQWWQVSQGNEIVSHLWYLELFSVGYLLHSSNIQWNQSTKTFVLGLPEGLKSRSLSDTPNDEHYPHPFSYSTT